MFSVKWMPGIAYQDASHTRGRKCMAQNTGVDSTLFVNLEVDVHTI